MTETSKVQAQTQNQWGRDGAYALSIGIYIHIETDKGDAVLRDSREIVKRLKEDGFELNSVRGSHHKFRKGKITIIVPSPRKISQ